MHALLDIMRENGVAVQENLVSCEYMLQQASENLTILDPELGEEELAKSVAAELAQVTSLIAENRQRQ